MKQPFTRIFMRITQILQVSNRIPQLYCGAQIRTPNTVFDVFGHIFERAKYSPWGVPEKILQNTVQQCWWTVSIGPPVKSWCQMQFLPFVGWFPNFNYFVKLKCWRFFVYWSVNLKLFVVYLYTTICSSGPKRIAKLKKKKLLFFDTLACMLF